jgi:hypothetical protein
VDVAFGRGGGLGFGRGEDGWYVSYRDRMFDTKQLLEAGQELHRAIRQAVDPEAFADFRGQYPIVELRDPALLTPPALAEALNPTSIARDTPNALVSARVCPPRSGMILAESSESRPSRYASLDSAATVKGMAAMRRTGEEQARPHREQQFEQQRRCTVSNDATSIEVDHRRSADCPNGFGSSRP